MSWTTMKFIMTGMGTYLSVLCVQCAAACFENKAAILSHRDSIFLNVSKDVCGI